MGFMDRILKRNNDAGIRTDEKNRNNVYISYARDDQNIADEICGLFEDNQLECFLKTRDLPCEFSFTDVAGAIEKASLFVLILSGDSVDSGFVNAEVDVAFSNEVPFCVFKVSDVSIEGGLELFLYNSPCVEAFGDYKDNFKELLAKSYEMLGKDMSSIKIPIKKPSISKNKVYISYSSKNMEIAERICEKLEEKGLGCWIASRNITSSRNYADEISMAIKNSEIFVPVFSKEYQESKYAVNELDMAFSYNKVIIPIRIDDSLPKGDCEFFLKNSSWIDASNLDSAIGDILSKSYESFSAVLDSASGVSAGVIDSALPTRLYVELRNIENNRFDISGRIKDNNGNALCDRPIKVYIDETFRYEVKSGSDGMYHCPVTFNKSGNRTLKVIFDGDILYSSSSDVLKVKISKFASEITFSADAKVVELGDRIVLYGNMKASDNPITHAYIDIYSGDELLDTVFTSASGNFSILVPTDEAKTMDFKAVFRENDIYMGCESSLSVSVTDCEANDRPFGPSNEKPYLFISYKHDDEQRVLPIIHAFHEEGYDVWFDGGLPIGEDYDDLIYYMIKDSALFVIFLSETVIEKAGNRKEYMKKELGIAVNTDKDMFPIYLDKVELVAKYMTHLQDLHSKFLPDYDDEDDFIRDCVGYFRQQFKLEPKV